MGLLHRLQRWITPILYRVIADPLQRPALLQKLSGAAKLKIIEDKLFSVIEQGRGGFHALMPLDEGELHIGAVKNLGFCFRPVFGWGAVIRSFVRSRFSIPATSLEDGGSYLENMEQDVRKGSF